MTTLPARYRPSARTWLGLGLGLSGLALLTALLDSRRANVSLATVALLYLAPVVLVGAVGGVRLALGAAVASDALLNWFFVPPYHTFAVERGENVVALLVYVLVAVTVAVAVDLAARQRAAAARSEAEAGLLARAAGEPVAESSLTQLLERVRETFGMRSVALVETGPDGADRVIDRVGEGGIGASPEEAPALSAAGSATMRLVAQGPELFAEDRSLLVRLAAAAARTVEAQRQAAEARRQAARAAELAEVDQARTAILAAVGHDLRTPLASIKAAASSLRSPEVEFSPEDFGELLATIEESADQLNDLVENLLAMSRLQAGVLSVERRPVALDEVVGRALLHAPAGSVIETDVPDTLPLVLADPGLLDRVVANLVSNAARVSAGAAITVVADVRDGAARLRLIDHGPGVPVANRERMFAPFQRLDDRTAEGGLGLGLAIARGFTTAMGGTLAPEDTPGGGLTMTVTLPLVAQ